MSQTKAQLVSPVGILTASGISVTGVVTASSFVGDVTGTSASFSGNVSIGGTLTYEDVTNIDSVGLITARSGIQVLAGGIDAVGVVTATSFVGNVTGNATGLSGTPNIVVGFATVGTALSLTGYYVENITAMGALDVDCSSGNYFTKTIAGVSTFTFSNVPSGSAYSFTLELTHTSGDITWPTEVKWPADTAPTLTTGNTHLFMFVTDNGGTRWRASSLIDYVD